jgi:hypothetical protein
MRKGWLVFAVVGAGILAMELVLGSSLEFVLTQGLE